MSITVAPSAHTQGIIVVKIDDHIVYLEPSEARELLRKLGDHIDRVDRDERQEREKADLEKRQDVVEVNGVAIVRLKSTIADDVIAAWPAGFTQDTAPWVVKPSLHSKTRKWFIQGPIYRRWPGDAANLRVSDDLRYAHLDNAIRAAIYLANRDRLPRGKSIRD